jgi:hypothetical protein
MCKKLVLLFCFVLSLGMVLTSRVAQADLVGYWKLDESSGTTAADSAGGDNNGTLTGNQLEWRPSQGKIGGALWHGTLSDSHVVFPTTGMSATSGTIAFWVSLADPQPPHTRYFFGHTTIPHWNNRFQLYLDNGNTELDLGIGDSHTTATNIMLLQTQTWYHIAATWDAGTYVAYVDGEELARGTYDSFTRLNTEADIGNDGSPDNRLEGFAGLIDDFRLYNHALTAEEIQKAMKGQPGPASGPMPADMATDVPRDVVLSWTPGEYAAPINGHRVYFSENFDDVNDGIGGIDQSASNYAPALRLDFDTTYYWRVDEVNSPPDYTVYQGSVWSFTTEPMAYPIENVNATASSANRVDEGPENTVNGSGLDDDDLHSSENTAMWLSNVVNPDAVWIQYEFDRIHRLYQMWVWNYNSSVEPIIGFSIKEATIEYSVDSTTWARLGNTHEFAKGPGVAHYAPNTTVDLDGVAAKYVKITANSNWGGIVNQFGLSEVRFFSIPVCATEPYPDSGATDVDVDVTLGFRAGREAAKHNVYLSTDEQAVIDGTVPVATVTEASYAPSLDLTSTYYWRIDEVNDAETPPIWQGDVWNFSTQEYLVVDDFESYNDISAGEEGSNLVYGTWEDGFENPVNGSTIGYNKPFQPTMETSIVYDGKQSVPLFYDNTAATYSEVTAHIADLKVGQDWSRHGIKALTLRFSGDPNNIPQQMYVKINGSKVTYDGSMEDTRLTGWHMWYVDLTSTGVSLSNVTELSIGFERIGAIGGQGMVLLDGIELYSYDRQLITPTDPGTTGLQVYYEFEGTADDSSGNARHGAIMGNPTFVGGKVGQAINLRGLDDYVEITGYKGVLGSSALTVTAWIKTRSVDTGAIVGWGPNVAGQRFGFRVDAGRLRAEHHGGNVQGDSLMNDNDWHHVAVTVQENATISYPDVILYLDGKDDTRPTIDTDPVFNLTAAEDVSIGRRPASDDRFFMGQIDEVRITNRALTQEEIAWLCGRTKPFDKPF